MNTRAETPGLYIPDLETGTAFLNRLPLANPAAAEEQLSLLLDSLLTTPPDPDDLFPLLEQTRVPLAFVEGEMALRYHNKPLPLAEVEETQFHQVIAAWKKMAQAYAICAGLQEPDVTCPDYAARIAIILHRCIYYTGMIILEHFRARRELAPGLWIDLHGYFATAEEWGVATTPVADPLDHEQQTTHCAAAYVTVLLVDVASPYSQSVRDLNLIRRWAGMWSPLVAVGPVEDDIEVPPFVVELMKDVGMHPAPYNEALSVDIRRLDTSRLGVQINQTLSQLRQRIPPSQLNLGEETNNHVSKLLGLLARPWTQSTASRKFRRFASSGQAELAVGFEAMYFKITGNEFSQPDSAQAYSRDQFDTLFTFRHMADPTQKLTLQQPPDYPCDQWEVLNHSASGFRLARTSVGQKMAHGQLLALRPHDGGSFLLAQNSWFMQELDGGLVAGVAVLPGMPSGVAIRLADLKLAGTDRYSRAFLLPPVPAIGESGSLVVPLGFYQASHVLDVVSDSVWQAKMKNILQRGIDFERISFERL